MLRSLEKIAVLASVLGLTAWAGGHLVVRMDWPWALLVTGYLGGFALITLAAFLFRNPELEED